MGSRADVVNVVAGRRPPDEGKHQALAECFAAGESCCLQLLATFISIERCASMHGFSSLTMGDATSGCRAVLWLINPATRRGAIAIDRTDR
jgi:hypothetical protein